jgi:hypothetical protein
MSWLIPGNDLPQFRHLALGRVDSVEDPVQDFRIEDDGILGLLDIEIHDVPCRVSALLEAGSFSVHNVSPLASHPGQATETLPRLVLFPFVSLASLLRPHIDDPTDISKLDFILAFQVRLVRSALQFGLSGGIACRDFLFRRLLRLGGGVL